MISIEEIFEAAVALPESERSAYLDAACAGQPDLRERVDALLRSHKATGFMDARTTAAPGQMFEEAGERIGRYRLLHQIGEGGFGVVWMAEQIEPVHRRVALKIIKAGMDTKEVVARFGAERQAMAMMDHPHIAKVFDAGVTDSGRPYFAMELVRGTKITEFCDAENLSTAERLHLFMMICFAVQHAHQKGVIHRDLKPSNILVAYGDDGPVPKVIDFGVAKALEEPLSGGTLLTRFEQLLGTPAYMSPEQAGRGPVDIDTRSDVYSLGVLLYELLTGRPPFDPKELLGAGLDEMRRVIREVEPPKPSTRINSLTGEELTDAAARRHIDPLRFVSAIRGDLDWIVMKALEKSRGRRYGSAANLAADLQRHLENQPVLARPPSACYVLSRFIRRHKFGFAAGIGIVLSIAGGVAGTVWALLGERDARKASEIHKDRAEAESRKVTAQIREASRFDAAAAQQLLAQSKWREAVAYLGRAVRYDPENRNAQTALWLSLRYGGREAERQQTHQFEHDSSSWIPCVCPSGTRVATASPDNSARMWMPFGAVGEVTDQWGNAVTPSSGIVSVRAIASDSLTAVLLKHEYSVRRVIFNYDGSRIITECGNAAYLWDATNGQRLGAPLIPFSYGEWDSATGGFAERDVIATFSPDGANILATGGGTVIVRDAKTGKRAATPIKHESPIRIASFSPDGTRIVTVGEDNVVRVWNTRTSQAISPPLSHTGSVTSALFSPDGNQLVTVTEGKIALIWDVNSGQPVGVPLEHTDQIGSARFSPDGTVVVTSSGHNVFLWSALTGRQICRPLEHESPVSGATFSPDGIHVLTAGDYTVRVWDFASGQQLGPPIKHPEKIKSALFTEDGTSILIVSSGKVNVWEARSSEGRGAAFAADSGKRLNLFDLDETGIYIAHLSPNGKVALTVNGHRARLWDTFTGRPIGSPLQHEGFINSATFSSDGTRVVTASRDWTARVWDANTGQPLGSTIKHPVEVLSAIFSPDGARIYTLASEAVRSLDAATGRPLALTEVKDFPNVQWDYGALMALSPDGKYLIATNGNAARVWEAATFEPVGKKISHKSWINSVKFSPDGTNFVTASKDGTAQIWSTFTGTPAGPALHHVGGVNDASFSSDGAWIVTAGVDRTAQVWNAVTSMPFGVPMEHSGEVVCASFSPNATWIVTVSGNSAILWDRATGQPVGPSLQHREDVKSAIFSPEGKRLISVSGNSSARVWDLISEEFIGGDTAEVFSAFIAGARLDPVRGSLESILPEERQNLRQKLDPALAMLPDWRFIIDRPLRANPTTAFVSPWMSLTFRQAADTLIGSTHPHAIREAVSLDPGNPLVPFAFAMIEVEKTNLHVPNPLRAAWLIRYGMKRLPTEIGAAELRIAARCVAKVAETAPQEKAVVLRLLDNAAKLQPEDAETQALRNSMQ